MDEEIQPAQEAPCSPLAPDFLLALFTALIIDILNWVLAIGMVANLAIGWAFILWAKSKGNAQAAAPTARQASPADGQAQNFQKKLFRKALVRWGGQFIPFWNNTFGWTRFVLDMLKQPKAAPGNGAKAKENSKSVAEAA